LGNPVLFECVPNVSEGRDQGVLAACAAAIESAGASLAHQTSDEVHNRAVFTFFGSYEAVLDASVALAGVAAERIDLRTHRGVHPRIGALDVLPFVPIAGATLHDAARLAHAAAERIWERRRVPSFYYGAASSANRQLPDVRHGGFKPEVGDVLAHPSAGAIAVGAREILVAFNVVLAGADIALARDIARRMRERDGGLRTLRALAFALPGGRVQISCNLTDVAATPLARVLELIRAHAAEAGATVVAGELIGLVPRAALLDAAAYRLGLA
jgi:glutamate formiminotransferase